MIGASAGAYADTFIGIPADRGGSARTGMGATGRRAGDAGRRAPSRRSAAPLPVLLAFTCWLVAACGPAHPPPASQAVAAGRPAGPADAEVEVKSLVYYGWGSPDTQYVRQHWYDMEEIPFDGVGILVALDRELWRRGETGPVNQLGWHVMGTRRFHVGEFTEAVMDLRAARWRVFTSNFFPVILSSSVSARGLHWFDEGRWRVIADNFRAVARLARESGVRGLILDPEHYGHALFSYRQQRDLVDMRFEEFAARARGRGRQVMEAVAGSLPEAVVISLMAYTLPLRELSAGLGLADVEYGLLPAFYDGLLEAMPSGARLVDGYEFAYGFKEPRQFEEGYRQIHELAIRLSGVPDRYRRHVRAGFGLWLDFESQPGYFSPEEFRQAVAAALRVSDRYVWIYTQGPKFFPPSEIAPACIDAIVAARRGVRSGSTRSPGPPAERSHADRALGRSLASASDPSRR